MIGMRKLCQENGDGHCWPILAPHGLEGRQIHYFWHSVMILEEQRIGYSREQVFEWALEAEQNCSQETCYDLRRAES